MMMPDAEQEGPVRSGSGCGCLSALIVVVLALMILPAWMFMAGGSGVASAQTQTGQVPSKGTFIWPIPGGGAITDRFGYRPAPEDGHSELHTGVDIAATSGTPVLAVAAGIITDAGWSGNYGQRVVIGHSGDWETWYGHLSVIKVVSGQWVSTGEVIGLVGSTGRSTGPHLHLEIRITGQRTPVDPLLWGVP